MHLCVYSTGWNVTTPGVGDNGANLDHNMYPITDEVDAASHATTVGNGKPRTQSGFLNQAAELSISASLLMPVIQKIGTRHILRASGLRKSMIRELSNNR
jgi:hypothetical protein